MNSQITISQSELDHYITIEQQVLGLQDEISQLKLQLEEQAEHTLGAVEMSLHPFEDVESQHRRQAA